MEAHTRPRHFCWWRKQKDWLEWEMSIKAELEIHKKLGMGVLVTPPQNMNIVGSRIILRYKLHKDGSISMCKSRLVAQGFTQQERINFNDTFSLMAKLTICKIVYNYLETSVILLQTLNIYMCIYAPLMYIKSQTLLISNTSQL